MNRRTISLSAAIILGLAVQSIRAADVIVQPSSASGFVVKDAGGANERLRVQESGAVSLPSVPGAPAQSQGLCIGAGGQLGPCSGGGGSSSYSAGTGLTLTGTTFAVAPTYRLPQGCAANQIPQWSGLVWNCATVGGGSAVPAGTVNQTLRYNASNVLEANAQLLTFSDGGLLAGGAIGTGGIPTTGAGARLMWYPAKGAFRSGYVTGMQWDAPGIGLYSLATGVDTIASGQVSTALGSHNTASGDTSTAMGGGTVATGSYSTAMGLSTQAVGQASTAMGGQTTATGVGSTAIGVQTSAIADNATAMGFSTVANANSATAMGSNSTASGFASTAMGQSTASGDTATAMGYGTIADGKYSTAMGHNVSTGGHAGSFIYGDSNHASLVSSTGDDQFIVVAHGGVYFDGTGAGNFNVAAPNFSFKTNGGTISSTPDGLNGVQLNSGAGAWTTLSDRNAKTAMQLVDPREVLKKVAALPMNTWQYKTQEAKYRHMGPMAQDFYAAFHLGESDKGIDTVDADGVALAAIQGVQAVLNDKEAEIASLRAETSELAKSKDVQIAALRAEKDREITALKKRVVSLETVTGDLAEMKAQLAALRSTDAAPIKMALQP